VQKSPLLAKLRTSLTGRVLRELKSLLDTNPARYGEFWKQYGRVMKEGLSGDQANRERLLELVRFHSTLDPEQLTSLKDYASRMREGQQEILYFSGTSREAAERHPNLEYFRRNGLEVLLLLDRAVDDFMMATLTEFEGKKFASIDSADLEAFKAGAPEPPPVKDALAGADLDGLVAYLKTTLGARVGGVGPSKRLVDAPATLVTTDGQAASLQKVMRMIGQDYATPPKLLEINPGHPLIQRMGVLAKQAPQPALLQELAEQMLDNCLLMEGLLEHPERMVGRIQSLMAHAARSNEVV
jgi:molecular chaperone HtpG